MKKLFLSLFFFLSITLTAQELIEKDKVEIFNLKYFEVEYTGQGAVDKETGFLRVNSSENFDSKHEKVEDIAMDYLQNKLEAYGLTDLSQFRVRKVVESLTGEFVYFTQYINEIPVHQTNFTVFIGKEKVVRFVSNEFRNISKEKKEELIASFPKNIEMSEAIDIAKKYLNISEKSGLIGEPGGWFTYFESKDRGLLLTWAVNINSYKPAGNWYVFVDAIDKNIVHVEDATVSADIPALVHNPNPLVTKRVPYNYGDPYNLRYVLDNWDNPTLNAAREQVILRDVLYNSNWNFYGITGPYCTFDEREDPKTQNWVQFDGVNFTIVDYKRIQREFATIMCYYHIDKSVRRLIELGYYIDNTWLKELAIDPHGLRDYNDGRQAHFTYGSPLGHNYTYIAFKDFTDRPNASEDGDVIWHEHAHAIQYHVGVGLRGSSVADKSVKEGCSFYWPTSYKLSISNHRWDAFGLWVNRGGSWWVANYNLKYPNNFVDNLDNVHENGLIFSAALLKIRESIVAQTDTVAGRDIADKLFLEMHFRWSNPTNFYNAANAYLESSRYYDNGKWYCLVFNTLNDFGLIANPNASQQITGTCNTNTTITNTNIVLQNVTINSGAVVKVEACGNVTLGSNVTVKSGATLEIKAGGSVIHNSGLIVDSGAIFRVK